MNNFVIRFYFTIEDCCVSLVPVDTDADRERSHLKMCHIQGIVL